MTTQADKSITIDTYNKTVVQHSNKFSETGARINDINKTFSYIKKVNPKVVEIGCGDGRDADEILKLTNDYIGVDLSDELLKIAKKRLPNANFVLEDFETYKFQNHLDIVFAFASLLHADKESVKNLLDNISKALNVGGVIFISTKYGEYERRIIDRGGPKVNFLYTPKIIEQLSPNKLKVIHSNIHEVRDQMWFEIILQKV